MFAEYLAKLTGRFWDGRRDRAPILVPFLIIAVAVGVLAWRSYQLSARMERGASTLAMQYAGYTADITARRVDAAVRSELARASDEWQQIERRTPSPSFGVLQEWINRSDWIVSAIYVPDADPASSIYVTEIPNKRGEQISREFYSSSGTVRYTYDPARLLEHVRGSISQRPLVHPSSDTMQIQKQADITIVPGRGFQGLQKVQDGFAFTAPLSPPLASYAVRAVVRVSYIGSGWENQGVISLVLSVLAIALTGLGALLTLRGLKKEAETMNLRAALIANVSHELRTPLSMIRLGAETLKRGAKLKPQEREDIQENILREVLHLSHLVENVLDVARMQHKQARALAFTPVVPRDLVRSLISTYESWIRSRGFEVTLQIDESVPEQFWDREAVSRALLNLVDNAMKYSADVKAIDVILRQDEKYVVIEVRDQGIGIEDMDLVKIFDPYYRAQFSDTQTRRGAGLGLTLVQQIVTSHGGRVEVESESGIGSTFRLLFPKLYVAEPEPASALARVADALVKKPAVR